jgi:NADH:ubiquinone oxidoreductase subunit
MDHVPAHHYISAMATIGTMLFTWLKGRVVGRDGDGNVYYEERRPRRGTHARRWVIYAGADEASRVPPEWHAWLHFTVDTPLPAGHPRPWQKPHLANATGTPLGYRPSGHDYAGGQRAAASGDYEAWTPGG